MIHVRTSRGSARTTQLPPWELAGNVRVFQASAQSMPGHLWICSCLCIIHSLCLICLVDLQERCAMWARAGECKNNPGYMATTCAKSCKKCSSPGAQACISVPPFLCCMVVGNQAPQGCLLAVCAPCLCGRQPARLLLQLLCASCLPSLCPQEKSVFPSCLFRDLGALSQGSKHHTENIAWMHTLAAASPHQRSPASPPCASDRRSLLLLCL